MQSTWNFIKRNKKTIFFATSAVVGYIGLRRYFSNLEKEWQHSNTRNFVSEVHKKGSYFDEAICIGNQMANKQFGLIIKKLKDMFNIVELLNNIKTAQLNNVSPSEQLKFYEDLKIEIFTYIISEIYSIAFLITYIRVQLSMISGVMYYENQINHQHQQQQQQSSINQQTTSRGGNTNLLKDTSSRYYMFISLLENFHQKGIDHLVNVIRKYVSNSFANTKVTDKITLKDIFKNLNEIKTNRNDGQKLIEENALLVYHTNYREQIKSLQNPDTDDDKTLNEMKACSKFVDEMIDIIKLNDFQKVIENCIDIGFSNLFDFINECFIRSEQQIFLQKNSNIPDDGTNNNNHSIGQRQFINPHQINVLLIKILPLIWTQVHCNESSSNNNRDKTSMGEFNDKNNDRNALLVQYLLCSDSLTCFSANIYEAFCNEK